MLSPIQGLETKRYCIHLWGPVPQGFNLLKVHSLLTSLLPDGSPQRVCCEKIPARSLLSAQQSIYGILELEAELGSARCFQGFCSQLQRNSIHYTKWQLCLHLSDQCMNRLHLDHRDLPLRAASQLQRARQPVHFRPGDPHPETIFGWAG